MLTYTWEEMDLGTATSTVPSATATAGPLFQILSPVVSPTRYFSYCIIWFNYTPGYILLVPGGGTRQTPTVRDSRSGGVAFEMIWCTVSQRFRVQVIRGHAGTVIPALGWRWRMAGRRWLQGRGRVRGKPVNTQLIFIRIIDASLYRSQQFLLVLTCDVP
jgi:hypothetical protein